MTLPLQIQLKASIFASEKSLKINAEFLEFGEESLSKFEIAEIRYGVKAINGPSFRIGRIFQVEVKSVTGKIIKIRFQSVYQVRRKKLEEKYLQILNALFENYFNDIVGDFVKSFNDKIDFDILGVTFTQEGVILNKNTATIEWLNLGTKNYWTYYSLFSKSDAHHNRSFYYLTDWNTIILQTVSRHILKEKGMV
ncbi:hypothetical protein [Ferruginibacter sp. SUN106]|uniref:hypothetical protein n=1 Tax=Ferruginibacter sp. SUN106 TaxID=2978348 RepID=UPI003D35CE83